MTDRAEFARRYGPVALVTGASSGIGEQFARLLAARGLDIVVTARRADRLDALAEQMRATFGVAVHVVPCDLASPSAAADLLRRTADLDVGLLISNAGLGLKGAHHKQDPDALDDLVNVNVTAPTLLTHGFVPRLLTRGRGGIMLISSIEGVGGFPWSAAYSASKAYVDALGEALWAELRGTGVDVLVAAPGSTATEIHELQGIDTKVLSGVMSPESVARLALDHLGGGPHYTTGALNKVLIGALSAMPRRLRVRAAGMGMRQALTRSKNPLL